MQTCCGCANRRCRVAESHLHFQLFLSSRLHLSCLLQSPLVRLLPGGSVSSHFHKSHPLSYYCACCRCDLQRHRPPPHTHFLWFFLPSSIKSCTHSAGTEERVLSRWQSRVTGAEHFWHNHTVVLKHHASRQVLPRRCASSTAAVIPSFFPCLNEELSALHRVFWAAACERHYKIWSHTQRQQVFMPQCQTEGVITIRNICRSHPFLTCCWIDCTN